MRITPPWRRTRRSNNDPTVAVDRIGRRKWRMEDGSILECLSTEEEIRMTPAERWERNNARAKAEGCPCGRPAAVVKRTPMPFGGFHEWWTCEEHAGAAMFSGNIGCYSHPAPCPEGENYGSGGPIGGPPDHFYCSHRDHSGAHA